VKSSLRYFLLLTTLLLISVGTTSANSNGRNLFTPASEAQIRSLTPRAEQIGTKRVQYVTLNADALALASLSRNIRRVVDDPGVVLNLFEDTVYTAVNTRIEPRSFNRSGYIWYGSIPNVAFSSVVMVVGDDGSADIRVLLPGKSYYVDSAGNGVYRVSEINTYEQRNGEDYVIVTPEANVASVVPREEPACIDPPNTPCTIDVMVVYTAKAAEFLGGDANAQIAIENTIALTNLTYLNSNVHFRVRLVHIEKVSFDENPFYNIEVLEDPSDGIIDNIHLLRDQYRADLVAMIPGTSASDRLYCGIANLPTIINEANLPDETGFSITEALCISDITFPHELGHNMGKAHDRANAGGAVHPYAYGYQDVASPAGADWGDFVTVMAYSTGGECPNVYQPGVCPAIAWWSNPELTINGKPLGTANENNALSLNQTARLIAQYRISEDGGLPTPTPTHTTPTSTIQPSVTPEPTSTGQPSIELVLNGGFEMDADSDKLPDGWSSNVAKVRKCNKPSKPPIAYEGDCALKLKSGVRVQQKLADVSMLGQGDVLTLSLFGKGSGSVRLKLIYTDETKDKLTVPFNSTSDYALFSGTKSLTGGVRKVKVRLTRTGLADNVSLTVQSPVIPLW
jgi:peptidyl-Asp metalloendopeptidase